MIHVCSLAALPATVKTTGASHVLTVMANVDQVARPASVLPANHLKVAMDDITEPMDGYVAPSSHHIEQVLSFVRGWDRSAPLVIASAIAGNSARMSRVDTEPCPLPTICSGNARSAADGISAVAPATEPISIQVSG